MLKIVTYDTLDDTILNKWHVLWESSEDGHFFNTPEWLLSYCAVQKSIPYTIVTIEENDELVLVLPLVTEKKFGVPVLCGPGGKFLNKSSLLIKTYERTILKELIQYLMKQGNFSLQELRSDVAETIRSLNKDLVKRESSANPYLLFSSDPLQYLSSKNRSQIRGILRKNEKEVEFKTFIGEKNALEVTFEIDNRSSKKQQGKATFVSDEDRSFCLELLSRVPQHVEVDILYYNKIPVVYGIGFTYKKIYHAFNTAFDADYRFLRPGKLLAYLRVKKLESEQYDELDFGRGNSVLKQEFTKVLKTQYDIYYSSNSVVLAWWNFSQKLHTFVGNNKRLYNIYLAGKKAITH